jgi:hypothetical protein
MLRRNAQTLKSKLRAIKPILDHLAPRGAALVSLVTRATTPELMMADEAWREALSSLPALSLTLWAQMTDPGVPLPVDVMDAVRMPLFRCCLKEVLEADPGSGPLPTTWQDPQVWRAEAVGAAVRGRMMWVGRPEDPLLGPAGVPGGLVPPPE